MISGRYEVNDDGLTVRAGIRASHERLPGLGGLIAGRYEVLDSGSTVCDRNSNLTWQRAVSPDKYNWVNAKGYCRALPLAGGGWRLPEKDELLALVVRGVSPTIDRAAFPDTPDYWFRTSTPLSVPPSNAWVVRFNNRFSSSRSHITGSFRVRCVR